MTPEQADNFRVLIRHMRTNVNRVLNMDQFLTECGTPACALGECQLIFGWKEAQMIREMNCDSPEFGLEDEEIKALFGTESVNMWRCDTVGPQEWADEAESVLNAHGYTLDPVAPVGVVYDPDKIAAQSFLSRLRCLADAPVIPSEAKEPQ